MEIRYFVSLVIQPLTSVLSPRKKTCHALILYSPIKSFLETHQDALAFTLQKDMWSYVSQITSVSVLITMRLGGQLHLYLALSTCGPGRMLLSGVNVFHCDSK